MDSSLVLPLQQQQSQRRTFSSWENLDRFIPNRSAMDFDYAHYMLTRQCSKKAKENQASLILSPSKEAYQKHLAETFNMNRTRILVFKNKPPAPATAEYQSYKPTKPIRSNIPNTADKILGAPNILDDYNLNLLDWSSANFISVALRNRVYLWNASGGAVSKFLEVDDDDDRQENVGPVTSVKWAPDGRRIAFGFNNSDVQVWDVTAHRLVATLKGGNRHRHQCRVGSLDWKNDEMLTTGGMDGKITNNDIRMRAHVVQAYRGHQKEVCGLKWSESGQKLASGGDDNLLHIWDCRFIASASNAHRQWLHRLEDHRATVRALAWCPFQRNLLASGGADRCIKFWNPHTGERLNSVDTGSQVCALLWNKNERELLSSHGFARNQLILWKYPSMVKRAELTGHRSRVLFMVQSPSGCTVASAAGDKTIRFWNVFGTPQEAKPASKRNIEPFANLSCIR